MPRTNEENADDSFLIPANSSVLIRRVPGMPRFPIVTGEKNPGSKRAHHLLSMTLKKKKALIAMILNLTLIPCRKPYQVELTTGISKTCGSTSGSSVGGNIPPEVLNFAEHCARNFCDNCTRDHCVSKSVCVCQRKIVADDPLPNKTLRAAINRIVYHSGNPSSANSGTSFQVRDVASAASKDDPRNPLFGKEKYETSEARKTKITIPSQPTSEKVNEQTSKGSTLLAGKQEQKREKKEGL
ncbi:DWNN domain - like 3 [Theobroma cacao]|nr:DWNN domain - like 3 [Theobroma cacao]